MVSLQQIKKAKELGKKLRIAREGQGQNLAILADQCRTTMVKLAALEAGNHFAFGNSIESLYGVAADYARVLSVDIGGPVHSEKLATIETAHSDPFIPCFLRKSQGATLY